MDGNKLTLDAANQILGRVASRAAFLLLEKDNPAFLKHEKKKKLIEIINASKIKFSGKKLQVKSYKRYSGYHSGLSNVSVLREFTKNPSYVLKKAIWGMLPKNKSRKNIIKNLTIKN